MYAKISKMMKYCFVKESYNWLTGIYERDSEIQETKQ